MRGAAVFARDGSCVEQRLEAPYEPEFVGQALNDILGGLDGCEFVDGSPTRSAFARLEHGSIAVLATEVFSVIAIGGPDLDPNLLWVAMGALESKLKRMSSPGSPVPNTQPSISTDLPSMGAVPSELDLRAQTMAPTSTLQTILLTLSEHVGPVARILVAEELQSMGWSPQALPNHQVRPLIDRLSRNIDSAADRTRFIEQLSTL